MDIDDIMKVNFNHQEVEAEERRIPDTEEYNNDRDDIEGISNPLETDVESERRIACDFGEYINERCSNEEGLIPVVTENTPECTERSTSEIGKNFETLIESLGNETLNVSKNEKESEIEEKPRTFATSKKQRRKHRKKFRAAQRQLVKVHGLINAGNRGISRTIQGILPRNEETRSRNMGSLATIQINQENQVLPVMPVDLQYRPLNRENQQYSALNQRSNPYPPQNQDDLVTLPRGDFSYNPSGCYLENRKRKLNDSTSMSGQSFKRPKHSDSPINTDLIRVIIKDSHQKEHITREELGRFRNAISQEIDRIQVGPVPRFNDAYLKLGGIVVESVDICSRDWLNAEVPKLNPWTGTRLKVVNLESREKYHNAIVWIPGLIEDPECILRRLEKQNPTLKTGAWRVHSRKEKLTPRGYDLMFEIPAGSMRVLKEMDFQPYLGLARVHVSVTKKNIQ